MKQIVPLFALFIFIFWSCEFDSDDANFNEVERAPEQINVLINLADLDPNQIIYVRNGSFFSYLVSSEGRELVECEYYLDNNSIGSGDQVSLWSDYPNNDQTHTLTVKFIFKSGSGSLADYFDMEMYQGESNLYIKFTDNMPEDFLLRSSIVENKYLKLEWDKPVGYGDIKYYEIYTQRDNELIATVTDTWFIDRNYYYGAKYYYVKAVLPNGIDAYLHSNYFSPAYIPIENNHFETERISSTRLKIKIHNPNPYSCKYYLTNWDNSVKYIFEGNEVVVDIGYPAIDYYNLILHVLPESGEQEDINWMTISVSDQKLNSRVFGHYVSADQLYTLENSIIGIYDANTMQQTNQYTCPINYTDFKVSSSGLIAILGSGFIYTFTDISFSNRLAAITYGYYSFNLTNNDKILVQNYDGFTIYDARTGNVMITKIMDTQNSFFTSKISSDGNYVLTYKNDWLEVFEIRNNSLISVKTMSGNFTDVSFHPLNPQIIVVQYSTNFEIINIVSGSTKSITGSFANVDPFTGNLLYKDLAFNDGYPYVYVLDSQFENELFKTKILNSGVYFDQKLYNNYLFTDNYYAKLSILAQP